MEHGDFMIVARDPEHECEECGHHRGMHHKGGCVSNHIEGGNTRDEVIRYCVCDGFVSITEGEKTRKKKKGRNKHWGWTGR